MAGSAQEKTAFIVACCVVACVVQAAEYHSAKRRTRFSAEISARATGLEPATTGSTVATNLGPESLKTLDFPGFYHVVRELQTPAIKCIHGQKTQYCELDSVNTEHNESNAEQ